MGAAYSGYTETVQVLLDGGANVGAQQDRGWTSLMFAADQGQAEVVRVLLAEGPKSMPKIRMGGPLRCGPPIAATLKSCNYWGPAPGNEPS